MTKYEFPWREKNIDFKNYIIEERKKYDELYLDDDFNFWRDNSGNLEEREYICLKATFCGIDSKRFVEYYEYFKDDDNEVYSSNVEVIKKNKEAIARLQQIDFVEVLKDDFFKDVFFEDESVEDDAEKFDYTVISEFLIPKDIGIMEGLNIDQIVNQWVIYIADTCNLILKDYSIEYIRRITLKNVLYDNVNDLFNLLSVLGYKVENKPYKIHLDKFICREEDQFLNDYLEERRSYHNEIQRNFHFKKNEELEAYFDNSYEIDGRQEYLYFEAICARVDAKEFFHYSHLSDEEYLNEMREAGYKVKDIEGIGYLDIEEETVGHIGEFTVISKFNLPKNTNILKGVSIASIIDQWAKYIEKAGNIKLMYYDITYQDCSYRKNKRVNSEPYKVNDLFHILNVLGYQITK
ncbi:hypothetical protein [Geosporobacter ferrireducens]|uniref:Uncharacterized protein n=1 Tax=Geosporobacter ferrireducens TaxID=1424294 RepID=A0A1D8GPH1_9FIRM|nr:hypothetical protein [Geosporobacter ferrireducens]AOT72803.1 hypothetical protein Gferi_26540 [Geosporobacter ferrireducens]